MRPSLPSERFLTIPFSKSWNSPSDHVRVCPANTIRQARRPGTPILISFFILLYVYPQRVTPGYHVVERQSHLLGCRLRRSDESAVGGAPGLHHVQHGGGQARQRLVIVICRRAR